MKTIKIIRIALAGLVLFGVTSFVFADVPVAKGPYIEGNIGLTNTNQSDSSSNALGFNINLGYKFIPFFAGEFGYTSYGASQSSFTGSHAFDLAAKGIVPFQEAGFALFAKLGAAHVTTSGDDSDNNTNIYFGFGGEYALKPTMLIVLQWTQANTHSSDDLQLLSIGASYLF